MMANISLNLKLIFIDPLQREISLDTEEYNKDKNFKWILMFLSQNIWFHQFLLYIYIFEKLPFAITDFFHEYYETNNIFRFWMLNLLIHWGPIKQF